MNCIVFPLLNQIPSYCRSKNVKSGSLLWANVACKYKINRSVFLSKKKNRKQTEASLLINGEILDKSEATVHNIKKTLPGAAHVPCPKVFAYFRYEKK